jgi:hypothetical protein
MKITKTRFEMIIFPGGYPCKIRGKNLMGVRTTLLSLGYHPAMVFLLLSASAGPRAGYVNKKTQE